MLRLVPTTNVVDNQTSYPTRELKRIVNQLLKDAEVTGLRVTVRHSRSKHATGYWRPYWYPDHGEDRPQIIIKLPRPDVEVADYTPYPRKREQGKRFPLADWREALVAVTAHEAEHARQYDVLRERSSKGKRRSQVELRCDLAAFRAWRRWREQLYTDEGT